MREESIAKTKDLLKLCKGDECNIILSKTNQTRVALKRNIEDARNQSKAFLELIQEIENLRETQGELKNWANRIEFILNILDVTGAFSSVQLLNKLKDSITLGAIQFSKSDVELYQEIKDQFEKEKLKLYS